MLLFVSTAQAGSRTTVCADLLQSLPQPVEQETDYYCGSACVQSLLATRGHFLTQDALAKKLRTTEERGTTNTAIIRLFRELGYTARATKNLSVNNLKKHLKSGGMVILDIMLEEDPHWAILVEIKTTKSGANRFVLMDPWYAESGYRILSLKKLLSFWDGAHGPRGGILVQSP